MRNLTVLILSTECTKPIPVPIGEPETKDQTSAEPIIFILRRPTIQSDTDPVPSAECARRSRTNTYNIFTIQYPVPLFSLCTKSLIAVLKDANQLSEENGGGPFC